MDLSVSIGQLLVNSPADPASVTQGLWLIIALPLLGAMTCGLFGRALGRANTNFIATAAVVGSFLLSALSFWALNDPRAVLHSAFTDVYTPYALGQQYGVWFASSLFKATFGLRLDHLSGAMILVITGVGALIHLYSTAYMEHDEGYWRYFAYLNLFVAMMLVLVLADNLALLFVGWEGVGLCSYLLIGFWYSDAAKAWAGRKAFVVNRIGDFGFLIGAFLLVLVLASFDRQWQAAGAPRGQPQWHASVAREGSLHFQALESMARVLGNPAAPTSGGIRLESKIEQGPLSGMSFGDALTLVLLLFMLGAAGKSAQIPLYVWLPDAMAGPTPVSALIHAATMVTAGVYLFSRLNFMVVLSPTAMVVIAVIGAASAILAAVIAFAQNDIKKVLAYSTISQLGFMFMAAGMGVFWAAMFHLVTHAFFKACLFLGAGSVMHGNAEETDITKLGGLRREMPVTWVTFLISTLTITGVVPLSGFFSKDAILHGIHSTRLPAYPWTAELVWAMGLFAAFCTAFYMFRLYYLTFEGTRSKEAKVAHAHESRWPMTVPLIVLAAVSVLGVAWGLPIIKYGEQRQALMENFFLPVLRTAQRLEATRIIRHEESPWGAWGLAWLIAMAGFSLATYLYTQYFPRGKRLPAPLQPLASLVENKFYVDELYDWLIVKPVKLASVLLYRVVDSFLIDTVAVRGVGWLTRVTGSALRYLQTGDTQSYAAVMAIALLGGLVYALLQVLR